MSAGSCEDGRRRARDQLLRAVVALREQGPLRVDSLRHRGTPRASAVLILVGVLDDVEADSAARGDGPAADLDLLLTQRAPTLRAHPGQVAFPGGRLDPEDGDPEDPGDVLELPGGPVQAAFVRAALREAQEETGLDPRGIEVLGALPTTPVPVSGHDVTPVIGWWARPSRVDVVDRAESALVFRVPLLDVVDPQRRHTAEVRRSGPDFPVRRHRSPAFRIPRTVTDPAGGRDEVVVWGFTGILLDRVLTAAGWARPWDRHDVRPAPQG
ncbi:CoA pyrophosphatase [Kocuria palustris]|uniref:NUDIX hydrolase n=1 Tax=Kocuria palustris TaxID=71999 RepID=UPI0011A54158|nr:CoA pyrophosphatase [Kocuria palustris]